MPEVYVSRGSIVIPVQTIRRVHSRLRLDLTVIRSKVAECNFIMRRRRRRREIARVGWSKYIVVACKTYIRHNGRKLTRRVSECPCAHFFPRHHHGELSRDIIVGERVDV